MNVRTLLPGLARATRATQEQDWERLRELGPEVVAFHHPDYRGVSQATLNLCAVHAGAHCQALAEGDVASPSRIARLVSGIEAAGVRCVVFSGFADGYSQAIRALSRALPTLAIRVMWHGSALQNVEDCNWGPLGEIVALAREGSVDRVGFLKRGMAEVVARAGIETCWLRNFVEAIPEHAAATPDDGRIHVGVWDAGDSWRKNAHAMLAGASLVDGAVVSGVLDDRGQAWCELVGLPTAEVSRGAIGHAELLKRLGTMHCNLYITLSECSPLLPLESLSQGVPCLVSATSHLFEESELLRRTLVVPQLDDPLAIADALRRAVAEREAVVQAYRDYAEPYNESAREAMRGFLGWT